MAANSDVVDTTKPEAIVPDTDLSCAFAAFAHVLDCPKRLEIGEVKALPLLRGVRQIKACARFDVVDVPALAPVVLPAHTGFESRFNPTNQEMPLASKELTYSERCFVSRSHQGIVYSSTVVHQHSEDRIGLLSRAVPILMGGSYFCISSIFFTGLAIQFFPIFPSPFPCFGFDMLSIFCFPFFKVLANLFSVSFSPTFVFGCEFLWIFLAITFLSQAAKFKFAFGRTYSFGDSEFSSSSSCTYAPTLALFFNCHHYLYRPKSLHG